MIDSILSDISMLLFKSDCKIRSDFFSIVISASNPCEVAKTEKEKVIILKRNLK